MNNMDMLTTKICSDIKSRSHSFTKSEPIIPYVVLCCAYSSSEIERPISKWGIVEIEGIWTWHHCFGFAADGKSPVGVYKRVDALQFFKIILIVSYRRDEELTWFIFHLFGNLSDDNLISIPFIDLAIFSIQ